MKTIHSYRTVAGVFYARDPSIIERQRMPAVDWQIFKKSARV